MDERKLYHSPQIAVLAFSPTDVVRTSNPNTNPSGNDSNDLEWDWKIK